jgi:hypothetical protein
MYLCQHLAVQHDCDSTRGRGSRWRAVGLLPGRQPPAFVASRGGKPSPNLTTARFVFYALYAVLALRRLG